MCVTDVYLTRIECVGVMRCDVICVCVFECTCCAASSASFQSLTSVRVIGRHMSAILVLIACLYTVISISTDFYELSN